jgi:hypothetical protein
MKKILISMLIGLMTVSIASAQMSRKDMEEFAKYKAWQKANPPTAAEQVGKFAGIGKEIGIALKDATQALDQGLTVTEDHVYKFANTTAGKVTIGMIVWKVAGKELLGLIVGMTLLAFLIPWLYFWTRYFFIGKMILEKKVVKSWWSSEKTYSRTKASSDLSTEAYCWWCGVFAVGSLMFFAGAMICFFGGN